MRSLGEFVTRLIPRTEGTASVAEEASHTDVLSDAHVQRVLETLSHRQTHLLNTNIRQLPSYASLSQADALRSLRALEKAGLVKVEYDLHDAFLSTIHVIET